VPKRCLRQVFFQTGRWPASLVRTETLPRRKKARPHKDGLPPHQALVIAEKSAQNIHSDTKPAVVRPKATGL
jgi:hypothetical protein